MGRLDVSRQIAFGGESFPANFASEGQSIGFREVRTGHVRFEMRGQLVLFAALGADVRSAVGMRHFVRQKFGTILKDFVARRAFVLGQMGRPVSFVRVARFDHFATQLARVQGRGLVLVGVVLRHLFHRPFDHLLAQLTRPRLVVATSKQEGIDPSVVTFLDKLFQLLTFFYGQHPANLLLQIIQSKSRLFVCCLAALP